MSNVSIYVSAHSSCAIDLLLILYYSLVLPLLGLSSGFHLSPSIHFCSLFSCVLFSFFSLFMSCSSVFSQSSLLCLWLFFPLFCSSVFFFFPVYFLFNFSLSCLSIRTWTGLLCWLRRSVLRSSPPLKDGRMLVTLTMSSLQRLRSWPHHVSPESWPLPNRSSS